MGEVDTESKFTFLRLPVMCQSLLDDSKLFVRDDASSVETVHCIENAMNEFIKLYCLI